jgi:hypothetical protein
MEISEYARISAGICACKITLKSVLIRHPVKPETILHAPGNRVRYKEVSYRRIEADAMLAIAVDVILHEDIIVRGVSAIKRKTTLPIFTNVIFTEEIRASITA